MVYTNIKRNKGISSLEQIKLIEKTYKNCKFNSPNPVRSLELCGAIGITYEAS